MTLGTVLGNGRGLSSELSCPWTGLVKSSVRMYRKNNCTTSGIGVGLSGGVCVGRMFKFYVRIFKSSYLLNLFGMVIQSNFSGSNTFGTMKISSRQG